MAKTQKTEKVARRRPFQNQSSYKKSSTFTLEKSIPVFPSEEEFVKEQLRYDGALVDYLNDIRPEGGEK